MWRLQPTSKNQELRCDPLRFVREDGDAPFQTEPRFAGVTGIEVKRRPDRCGIRLVGMTENHGAGLLLNDPPLNRGRGRADVENVMDQELVGVELDQLRLPEGQTRIVVAQNGRHRRDLAQFQNNPGRSDVARMENMVHPGEEILHSRVEVAVRIGDDANSHINNSLEAVSN